MAPSLGLDLGSYALKAVVLDTSQKQAPVLACVERPRTGPDALGADLQQLLAELGSAADQVVVSLPGPSLATHRLTLPFADPKRIEATLPFELESQLPFDLDGAVFDYQLVRQQEKGTDLLVGVVRKQELQALLATLGSVQVDPRVVTHPALVYHLLLAGQPPLFEPVPDLEALALVDVGHERTSVCIGRPGTGVEHGRVFPGGGKDLTRVLASEFQIPLADANAWKEAHGAIASAARGPDGERAGAAFARALLPVLRELRATFKAYAAHDRRNVTRVVLCGGSSRLLGLDEHFERELGMPVRLLALPAPDGELLGRNLPAAAQAYALAQRGQAPAAKAPRFNLRRGDLAYKGQYDYLKDRVGRLAAYAAVLVFLLLGFGITRSAVLSGREQKLDAQLCDLTQRVLGQCEKNYDRALNMLKGKGSPSAAIPKYSAVTLLAALTEQVPPDTGTTFDQIQVDLDRISVRGETDSSKQVDKLTSALKGFRCFREVKPGKVEKARSGNKVVFHLDIQVECPDQLAVSQG